MEHNWNHVSMRNHRQAKISPCLVVPRELGIDSESRYILFKIGHDGDAIMA